MIYHITSRLNWERAQAAGLYSAPSLASEGFIHCSRRSQIITVANNFYRNQPGLLLLCIEESKLKSALRWEAPAHPQPRIAKTENRDERFPHVYGTLNLGAVAAVFALEMTVKGFVLPKELP